MAIGVAKLIEEAVFVMNENIQRSYTYVGDLLTLDFDAKREYHQFTSKEITIAYGYSSIIESIATVDSEPSPVKLHFEDSSTMVADHVFVTVSSGILKARTQEDPGTCGNEIGAYFSGNDPDKGYQTNDPDVCLPDICSFIEQQITLIVKGDQANYSSVMEHLLQNSNGEYLKGKVSKVRASTPGKMKPRQQSLQFNNIGRRSSLKEMQRGSYKHKRGDPLLPRQAFVIVYFEAKSNVLVVDLGSSQVLSHVVNPDSGYPILTAEDMAIAVNLPLANAEFNKSIIDRGVKINDLKCVPLATGWYGPNEEGRRVINVRISTCGLLKDSRSK
ncbi:hypothetical protein IFM89_030601 [Coptis chinensis]|uniref:Amine oxidase n=1 Tax=Coptis chinensis TaxID=261450 RepID=A0A835HT27_9MAGN|nr:hypothetical protein IFM89_030601 [Coptis chinensis]